MKLVNLSFNKISEYLANSKTIIIPIGSTEQHGQALPLSTDTLIAEFIAKEISKNKNWIIGPTINIGYSDKPQPFMKFAGTITYNPETLMAIICDYVSSVYLHGFREIFIVNGHGGNNKLIKKAAVSLRDKFFDIQVYLHNWWKIEGVESFANTIDKNSLNHAGTLETALAFALFGDIVNKDKLTKEYKYIDTETGVIDSDQTLATMEMGKETMDLIIEGSLQLLGNNKESFLCN